MWRFLLLAAVALALPRAAAADPVDQTDALRPIAAYVANARLQIHADNLGAGGDLPRAAEALTRMIAAGTLDGPSRSIAHYYRGQARYLQNVVHEKRQEKIDPDLARAALADFDQVIAAGIDIRNWGISIADTDYEAGVLVINFMKDQATAYVHWRRCAEDSHAGCMGLMADARLTGVAGVPADVKQALTWHTRVYETGVSFKCAGAFSARAMAEIEYFTGVRRPGDEPLDWLAKATALLDKLTARNIGGPDPCGRSAFAITEFLIRLGQNQRRDEILHPILAAEPDSSVLLAAARYFTGALDEPTYRATVAQVPVEHQRCLPYLYGLWFQALSGRPDAARVSFNALVALGEPCAKERLYARKFGLGS